MWRNTILAAAFSKGWTIRAAYVFLAALALSSPARADDSAASGKALGPDEGCTNTFAARVEDGRILLALPAKEAVA